MKSLNIYCLVILSFFILHNVAKAQDEKKISFSLDYTPGLSYRFLSGDDNFKDVRNNQDVVLFTQGVCFFVSRHLTQKLNLKSGLGYQVFGDRKQYESLTFDAQIDSRKGFIFSSDRKGIKEITIRHQYAYLSMPFLIDYQLIHKNTSALRLDVGVKVNYMVSSKRKEIFRYEDDSREKNTYNEDWKGKNDFGMSGFIGVFWHKQILKNKTLRIGPSFDCFLTSISDTPLKAYYYKASLHVGIGF